MQVGGPSVHFHEVPFCYCACVFVPCMHVTTLVPSGDIYPIYYICDCKLYGIYVKIFFFFFGQILIHAIGEGECSDIHYFLSFSKCMGRQEGGKYVCRKVWV